MKPAWVYLIGAGPGDPSLVSVRGLKYVETADVVVYDRLVHKRHLRSVRPDAEQIDVGAAAPRPLEQDAINILLQDKAREGKTVARLKWGDPFVFDSGGKEALFLHQHGIPFEVVPGIPPTIGGPCYAGVPLTYPEAGDALIFIRGHEAETNTPPDVDWEKVARIAAIDVLGTTPFWQLWGRELDEYVGYFSRKVASLGKAYGKEPQVWLQGFLIPAGREAEIEKGAQVAYEAGVRNIAAWGFRGCAHMAAVRSERPEEVWRVLGRTFASLRAQG